MRDGEQREITLIARKHIQFGLLSAQDVVKISEFEVTHRDLYTAEDRLPVRNGPLDRRLVSILSYFLGY